jgi:hypothetical protein
VLSGPGTMSISIVLKAKASLGTYPASEPNCSLKRARYIPGRALGTPGLTAYRSMGAVFLKRAHPFIIQRPETRNQKPELSRPIPPHKSFTDSLVRLEVMRVCSNRIHWIDVCCVHASVHTSECLKIKLNAGHLNEKERYFAVQASLWHIDVWAIQVYRQGQRKRGGNEVTFWSLAIPRSIRGSSSCLRVSANSWNSGS